LEFKADFHSKMSVCRHELGGGVTPQPPVLRLSLSAHISCYITHAPTSLSDSVDR